MTSYALTRPMRLDLEGFASATGLHPDFVLLLVDLGLLEGAPASSVDLWFTPEQILVAARLHRLRAGFSLNYAALGLVVDLLDRIAELEAATRARRVPRHGGPSWT
ncbi:MAG: MerR family transcriptional regulator [Frankiaceae bacterium]|nr:MerR family transcriptional regulator [Frankiaceae bacterium]MBV9872801.1 MerR family transcriptional regulator [Frankiaceae bacterium]